MTRRSFRSVRNEARQRSRDTSEDDAHGCSIGRLQVHRGWCCRARQTALGAGVASIAGMFVELHRRRFDGRGHMLMVARMSVGRIVRVLGMIAMKSEVSMPPGSTSGHHLHVRLHVHHLAGHRHGARISQRALQGQQQT